MQQGADGGVYFCSDDQVLHPVQDQVQMDHVTKPWTREAWERARPWVLEQRQKLEVAGWSVAAPARVSYTFARTLQVGVMTHIESIDRRNSSSSKRRLLTVPTRRMDVSVDSTVEMIHLTDARLNLLQISTSEFPRSLSILLEPAAVKSNQIPLIPIMKSSAKRNG